MGLPMTPYVKGLEGISPFDHWATDKRFLPTQTTPKNTTGREAGAARWNCRADVQYLELRCIHTVVGNVLRVVSSAHSSAGFPRCAARRM